jgi:arylsulfatase A-like enzyme
MRERALHGMLLVLLAAMGGGIAWRAHDIRGLPRERVALQLGPGDFGQRQGGRTPMATVGTETRAVLVAPERVTILAGREVTPEDGRVSLEVVGPPESAALPDSAFRLSLIDPSAAQRVGSDDIALAAALTHWKTVERWTLRRDPAMRNRLTIEIEPGDVPRTPVRLQLDAVRATPAVLSSRPFDVPTGGRLELFYTLAHAPRETSAPSVTFSAHLACGASRLELWRDEMTPEQGMAPGWRTRSTPLPRGARDCRLDLRAEGGGVDAAPVWSPPRVVVPDHRPAPGATTPRSVILVSLDTLRADHLSSYGYPRETSPAIDRRLAAAGTLFTDVSTTFPLTNVAHMALMTGLYAESQPTAPASPTMMADVFRAAGFTTQAFTEDGMVTGAFGFWSGFDAFVERPFVGDERGRGTFRDGAEFLRTHGGRPFFLFLHTYKVHHPYAFGPRYAQRFAEPDAWSLPGLDPHVPPEHRPNMDAYDRAICEVDDQVAELLDALEGHGLEREVLLVIVSDHGEAFGEHGALQHGTAAHQEQLHVPLILRGPGIPPARRIDDPASLVDVAPTVFDLLGLPPLASPDGRSLRPLLDGGSLPPRPIYFAWMGGSGVRSGQWKAHRTRAGVEIFDLARDPRERMAVETTAFSPDTLLAQHRDETRARKQQLTRLAADGGGAAPQPMTPELERSLRALGYVQ